MTLAPPQHGQEATHLAPIPAAIRAAPPAAWRAESHPTTAPKESHEMHETSVAPKALEIPVRPGVALRREQDAIVKTIGARLRAARKLSNLSLSEAARRLGYSNPSKLSKVENAADTNSVPLRLIRDAAELYEVTTDYLFGLNEDWECGSWRGATPWLLNRFEQIRARDMAALMQLHQHARTVSAVIPSMKRDAQAVIDAYQRMIELTPKFDDIRGGARLLAAAEHLAATAGEAVAAERRLRLKMASDAPESTTTETEEEMNNE